MKKIIILLFVVVFLTGCASFYCSRYPNNTYSPTVADNIPIYNNFPPSAYEVIGEVGANGAPASSWGGIGKRMREYAAQIGGDAIVIQDQATPYAGTYSTPGHSTTSSSAYGSAYGSAQIYGNSAYGQAQGSAYGTSQTTYYPGQNIPMFGKSVKGAVIKFQTLNEKIVDDDKYGKISDKYFVYYNPGAVLAKKAQLDLSKVFDSYQKTAKYDKILEEKGKSNKLNSAEFKKERDDKLQEILKDIKKACVEYGSKNGYKVIYNDKMPNVKEDDISNEIIGILNNHNN